MKKKTTFFDNLSLIFDNVEGGLVSLPHPSGMILFKALV